MRFAYRFLWAFLFNLLFVLPVFAADFTSEIHRGFVKKHALDTEHFTLEFSDLILNQTDSDSDSISDTIELVGESAEHAWDVIIEEMGYEDPLDSDRKLIFILDDTYEYLESGALGITSLLSNGDPYIAVDPWIDENYLAVTVGHEFYHAVQFGYDVTFAYTYQGINWAEASATWMEDELFDSIDDYVYYLQDFFSYVDYSIFASVVPTGTLFEYGLAIWPRFLSEYYESRDVVKDIWETYFSSDVDYESDLKVYEAVKDVVEEEGDDLNSLFQEFTLWNLDPSLYEEGELYPGVFLVPEVVLGSYIQIAPEYAPALYGTNYLYFENLESEDNFYFHILKPEGVTYALSLIPVEGGITDLSQAVKLQVWQEEAMDDYLSLSNLASKDGLVAVVSALEKEFDTGYNWEVFDEGYFYQYLALYGSNDEAFLNLMETSSEEVEELEATEEKEGEAVEASVGPVEDTLRLTIVNYDEDSVIFSWNRLDDEAISGYELRYGLKSGEYTAEKEIEKAYTTYSTVSHLEENETYYFQLIAIDGEGDQVGEATAEVSVTPMEWIFTDVSYVDEYYDAISILVDQGIFQGYTDGSFRPDQEINRAELLKILMEGRDLTVNASTYKNCFPDVQQEWFAKYLCYAKSKGWVQGYEDGFFRPEQSVNKVEALKILFKVYEMGLTEGVKVAKLNYTDLDTSAWYAIYVWKASQLGILEEAFGGEFNPELARTRGEMAEELYRYLVTTEEVKVE